MSRRKKRQNCMPPGEVYWQAADYNQRVASMFLNQACELAMARFKWLNLPPTCDERFLEYTLLMEGVATIASPWWKRLKGRFFSTQAVTNGRPNIYNNPTHWRSFGVGGWEFPVAPGKNGVLVYDNLTRYPLIYDLRLYANELADILRTKQVNRLHVKSPYILTGPEEQEQAMVNLFAKISGNEPAVLGYKSLDLIKADKIDTQVPFLGKELNEDLLNTWNQVYMRLGIKNLPWKSERQIEDEVASMTEPSDLARLSPLACRRKAADELNRRFAQYLDAPIKVVWNTDAISENHNLITNLGDMAKLNPDVLMGGDEA